MSVLDRVELLRMAVRLPNCFEYGGVVDPREHYNEIGVRDQAREMLRPLVSPDKLGRFLRAPEPIGDARGWYAVFLADENYLSVVLNLNRGVLRNYVLGGNTYDVALGGGE